MATLIYVTGNGYQCGCCRRTWTEYEDFDEGESGIEDLISECVEKSLYAEGDFSIDAIKGYSSDATALENRITAAIAVAEKRKENQDEINNLKRGISELENWFASLEATKESKTQSLATLRTKLSELEK